MMVVKLLKSQSETKTTNHADDPIKICNLSSSVFTLLWFPNCFAHVPLLLNFFLLAGLVFALLTFKQGDFTKFLDLLLKSEPFPLLDSFRWHFLDLSLFEGASCPSSRLLTDNLGKEYEAKSPAFEFRRTTPFSLDLYRILMTFFLFFLFQLGHSDLLY